MCITAKCSQLTASDIAIVPFVKVHSLLAHFLSAFVHYSYGSMSLNRANKLIPKCRLTIMAIVARRKSLMHVMCHKHGRRSTGCIHARKALYQAPYRFIP